MPCQKCSKANTGQKQGYEVEIYEAASEIKAVGAGLVLSTNAIKALKAMGVKGFRIDAAKHMSIEHLKRVWTEDITKDIHIFGRPQTGRPI